MRAILLACFFLSGSSGLILESLWTRELGLVFGSTTLAISTVLATFMGGLGLGSYLAGRYADRIKNPVRAYAIAEAGIGLYALLIPVILWAYPALNHWMYSVFGDRWVLLSMVRFVGSAALLLIPTTLMGATLPLLARHFVMRPWELRRAGLRIGTLYAINLFGAVAGAFFSGFVFLPLLGVTLDQRDRRVLQPDAGGGDHHRAPPPPPRRRSPPAAPRSAWTGGRGGQAGDRRRCRPAVVDARSRRAALAAFAVSGATAMTLAGAVDARAGGGARLVGVLVHAHPAGVPGRPGRGRGRVRALEPAHGSPDPLAGGAAPGDRRRCRPDLPVHRQAPLHLHLARCRRPASASTRSCSASSCSRA